MSARSEAAAAAARRRAARTRRVEAVGLGLLALLPVVPHLTLLLRVGVPRFGLLGDFARLEQALRHVWAGDTLLGPAVRSAYNHPGPLFFYLSAPFQRLFGTASTGLYVGACFVSALSAGATVGCARLFGRRSHAIAALLVVLAWFVAFGNVAANPWSPASAVLPLLAFLVNAAMLARGKSGALYTVAFFGALAAQPWAVATAVVVPIAIVAFVAFLVGGRRRGGLERFERWRIAIAAAVLFGLFVPTLVEQLLAPTGNLTRLVRVIVHRSAPTHPLSSAAMSWTTATAWLPERLAQRTLIDEAAPPSMLRAEAMRDVVTSNARLIAIVHVATVACAAIIASRRRDLVSVGLLAFGLTADAIGVIVLARFPGTTWHYVAFWTTAASSVAWMGVLSTLFSAIGALAPRVPRVSGVIAPALTVVGLSTAVTATSLQRFWIARHPTAPEARLDLSPDLRALEAALRARMKRDDRIPVVHRDGAGDIADGLVLELEKDEVDVRVGNADRDAYVGVRTANGVDRPLHVWLATPWQPLRMARCPSPHVAQTGSLELIARSGNLALFGSPVAAPACVDID